MTGPFKLMSTTLFRSNYDFFDKLDGSGLFLNFNVDDNKNFPDIMKINGTYIGHVDEPCMNFMVDTVYDTFTLNISPHKSNNWYIICILLEENSTIYLDYYYDTKYDKWCVSIDIK